MQRDRNPQRERNGTLCLLHLELLHPLQRALLESQALLVINTDRWSVQTDDSGRRRDLKNSWRGDLPFSRHDQVIRRVMDHWRSARELLFMDCFNTRCCGTGFRTGRTPEELSGTMDSFNTSTPRLPWSPWSSLNSWTVSLCKRKRQEIERCSTRDIKRYVTLA